jgi:hypothetical protein
MTAATGREGLGREQIAAPFVSCSLCVLFRFGEIGDGAFGGVWRFVVFFEKVGLEEEECDLRGLSAF